jgi:hypothetical protein
MSTILSLPKEHLGQCTFAQGDVLKTTQDKVQRNRKLQNAMILGNSYHHKVKILFQLADGQLCQVETTVWEADDRHLSLKGGHTIPVSAVWGVEL